MQRIRKFCLRPRVTRPIIGVFILWAGMFTCLLPAGGLAAAQELLSDLLGTPVAMAADQHHGAGVDCLGSGSPTFCKTEGRMSLVPDLAKLPGIIGTLMPRLSEYLPFHPRVDVPLVPPVFKPVDLLLFVCSFLK